MNLIPWNIVRKDFRLTRFYLVAWWGILAAGLFNVRWCLNKIISEPNALYNVSHGNYVVMLTNYFTLSVPFYLIWVFVALALFLLPVIVDLVVKADSPIDERAVWRTRPVSGLAMWRAKVFYFGFFCIFIPGAVFTVAHLTHGGALAEDMRLLLRFGITLACLIAVVGIAGVLFERTFTGLLVFVAMALGFFVLDLANLISQETFDVFTLSFRQGWINAWVAMGIFVITGLVVTALSYDGRRRTPCRVVLGGGVLAALIALWVGPQHSLGNGPLSQQQDDRVKMALGTDPKTGTVSKISTTSSGSRGSRIESDGVGVQVSYQAMDDEVCRIDSIAWKLTFSNPAATPPNNSYNPYFLGMFNLAAAVANAGYGTLLKDPDNDNTLSVSLGEKTALEQLGPGTVKLEGRYTGQIGHLEKVSDVPYFPDVVLENGLKMFKIESVPYSSQAFSPGTLGRTDFIPLQADFNRWEVNTDNFQWLAQPTPETRSQILLLYNPLKHESMQGFMYGEGSVFENNGLISIYSLKRGRAFFPTTAILGDNVFPHRSNSRQEMDNWIASCQKTIADWLANARLVELRFVPDQSIYDTVTIDAIPLNTPAPAPAANTGTP